MKIAIIGAGFAGLATAWHLAQYSLNTIQITLFDHLGVGGKASGIAGGLLHPYSGLHAKLNRFGKEAYNEACKLLEISQANMQQKVFLSSGMLRLALTKSQETDYFNCSYENSDVRFLTAEKCQELEPLIAPFPGILISNAKTVYTKPYLKGLLSGLTNLRVDFKTTKIQHLDDLKEFDRVVVTAGADTALFSELKNLALSFTKGQILEIEWPADNPPLKLPINSQGYLLMSEDNQSCIAGATFERNFASPEKDCAFAASEIMPKITSLVPCLKNSKVLNCSAAIRVSTKDHLPLIQKINPRLFVFVGLGSKGLLYHGFYAKKLAEMIMNLSHYSIH